MSRAAEEYLSTLYSRCTPGDGEIVLVDSTKRQPIGSYQFDELPRLAVDIRMNAGCFIKINPMDAGKIASRQAEKIREHGFGWCVGNAAEVRTVIGFHLDVDANKGDHYPTREQAIAALWSMPVSPTLVVNSDSQEAGLHAYWLFADPQRIRSEAERKEWSEKSRRWLARLREAVKRIAGDDKKVDSTANLDRALRPVGSVRASGNLVSIHCNENRFYSVDDLYLPPSDEEIQVSAAAKAKALFDSVLGPVVATGRPIQDFIDAAYITPETLLAEAGYVQLRDPLEWRRPGAANPGRSLKIATKLDTPGINVFSGGDPLFTCTQKNGSVGRFYSVAEMFVILRHAGNWKAAAGWCRQQIGERIPHPVGISEVTW